MKNELVITGHGIVTSIGCGAASVWKSLTLGKTNFRKQVQLSEATKGPHLVAYVDDLELKHDICPRILRKLDRFTLLSMQSFAQVIQTSALTSQSMENTGIFLGNSTGGWSFVEPQMEAIYEGNYDALSPYVATAWFPTAPQGELSIQHKIAGYSKTFSADALSVGHALDHCCYLLQRGTIEAGFVGGVEAPLSTLVYNGCLRAETLSRQGCYLPFHKHSDGYLLGEGAGFVLMELEERARARDASLLARVASIAFAPTCAESIQLCLEQAKIRPKDINCVFLDAKADLSWDVEELNDLNQCFQGCPELYLTTTKPLHGSLLAADFAVQLVIAVLALIHQKIPRGLWSENHHKAFPVGRLVLDDPIDTPLKHVLLYARNLDGSAISVLLERP